MSWEVIKLKRIASTVAGGTPPVDVPLYWSEEETAGLPWVSIGDMSGQSIVTGTGRRVTQAGVRTSRLPVGGPGTLLLSMYASLGHTAVLGMNASWNQALLGVFPGGSVHPGFLKYALDSIKGRLGEFARSNTQANLNAEQVGNLEVPHPPLEEQRRIADFLDAETTRIDKLVALREEMNCLLSQRRERIIDLEIGAAGGATADFAPLRYLIDRVGVGIVITPAAWYVDPPGIPAIRGVNVKAGKIDDEELVHISQEGNALHRKSQLESGDVVVVRTGQAGTAAVVPPELAGANCIDLVIVKPSERLVPRYLEYVLNSDYAKDFVVENSVGTIQSHFNVSAMKRIPVPSIPVPEQEAAVKRLDERIGAIDRLRASVARQRELLSQRRQALITAAVTGEFDVSAASGRGIEE